MAQGQWFISDPENKGEVVVDMTQAVAEGAEILKVSYRQDEGRVDVRVCRPVSEYELAERMGST